MADDDRTSDRKKIAITNNDQGPRYAFTARGQEVLQPGETLTTQASSAQVDAIKLNVIAGTDDVPMFTVESTDDDLDTGADQGKALVGLPVSKLRSVADAEGVQLTGRKDPTTGNALPDIKSSADIIAAIEAHRLAHPAGDPE